MADTSELTHAYRSYEIDLLRPWLKPGMNVLELGGGDGFQARRIADWGMNVSSIDIPQSAPAGGTAFPVQIYNGRDIPFADNNFDAVFSSNTLEHIPDVHFSLKEIHRVLQPQGLALHLVPSASWRLWTSLAHYPNLLKSLAARFSGKSAAPSTASEPASRPAPRTSFWRRGLRALLCGPHGEYPNAFAELYYFSRRRWLKVFKETGFSVVEAKGNGLFYSGYIIFENALSLPARQRLSRILGSSCHVFILRAEK